LLGRLRSQHLLLLRVTHWRLLCLILPALLALRLNLLLRSRTLLLLRLNCLLSGRFPLCLLLLSLVLTRRLAYSLAFCLDGSTLSRPLVRLLSAQLLHLLSRVSIAARRLSCQVGHLSFARLLGRKVWLLSGLSRLSCCALIRDLQLLILHSII